MTPLEHEISSYIALNNYGMSFSTSDEVAKKLVRAVPLLARVDKLVLFKVYVHKWLDDMGVPADPDPEKNARTGCRLECRLDWLKKHRMIPIGDYKIGGDVLNAPFVTDGGEAFPLVEQEPK